MEGVSLASKVACLAGLQIPLFMSCLDLSVWSNPRKSSRIDFTICSGDCNFPNRRHRNTQLWSGTDKHKATEQKPFRQRGANVLPHRGARIGVQRIAADENSKRPFGVINAFSKGNRAKPVSKWAGRQNGNNFS
jgi:hypothetical protein